MSKKPKPPQMINPAVKASHLWNVVRTSGTIQVHADVLTVTASGALVFTANVGGAIEVIFAVAADQYVYAHSSSAGFAFAPALVEPDDASKFYNCAGRYGIMQVDTESACKTLRV
jgi:hypothetical protein